MIAVLSIFIYNLTIGDSEIFTMLHVNKTPQLISPSEYDYESSYYVRRIWNAAASTHLQYSKADGPDDE